MTFHANVAPRPHVPSASTGRIPTETSGWGGRQRIGGDAVKRPLCVLVVVTASPCFCDLVTDWYARTKLHDRRMKRRSSCA